MTTPNEPVPVTCRWCGQPWDLDLIIYSYDGGPVWWWCCAEHEALDIQRGLSKMTGADDDDEVPF